MTELELRSKGEGVEVLDVSFPRRIIEIVVMPYESPTLVRDRSGRVYEEVVSRGAWDGIQRRSAKVRVNRDHQAERTIGKAVAFHPSRIEGLVSELRIARTPLGDETLALAEDECLDASAGFGLLLDDKTGKVYPDAEVWETRSRRRLNKLYLGHIALTPDPAYKDARVLSVRSQGDAEPEQMSNRERLELQRLREVYAAIDARYIQQ